MSKIYCPNCGDPAREESGKIICESCDAIFKISREGAKAEKVGFLDDLNRRISILEAAQGVQPKQQPKSEDEEPEAQEPEEEDIL